MQNKKMITILLTETKGWFGKTIHAITQSDYSHASISLDGENFYSFSLRGFVEEHPHHMKQKCKNVCINIEVYPVMYKKLEKYIQTFRENKEKYSYSVIGLLLCVVQKSHKFRNKYFCSQFVADLISKAGVVKLEKNPALYYPHQLMGIIDNIELNCNVVCNAF